ncbi:hypothetical protein ANN_00214 [Periplaneta americana]|uniref:C2H2-type domain-containing protein n=1 Tax=Periplaneta americana TaxID=6978 RepID=A0ABQ8TR89_PERAM|nr:hypothetical protein ANN_00214 [Periplaneta americana]
MEVIKTEPEIDPLVVQNDNRNEGEGVPLSTIGNFLKVNVSKIKVEPSEVNYSVVSNIKVEENEDPTLCLLTKFEADDDSWSLDAIKKEPMPNDTKEDVNFTDRSIQQHWHEVVESREFDVYEKSVQHYEMVVGTQTHQPYQFDGNSPAHYHKCAHCDEDFATLQLLKQHRRIIHPGQKPFKCDICVKAFTRLQYLKHHMLLHSGEKFVQCDVCGKKFTSNSDFTQHARVHSKDNAYKCDICSKNFWLKSRLEYHIVMHMQEKPYKCEICGKGFVQSHCLKQHVFIHTLEKAFKCDICGKTFRQSSGLRQHVRFHVVDKLFKCDLCGKDFKTTSCLKEHVRVHTGEKPFECARCGKNFRQLTGLRYHMRIHTGEKPFKCDICGKEFIQSIHLKEHLRIGPKQKPLKCDCPRSGVVSTLGLVSLTRGRRSALAASGYALYLSLLHDSAHGTAPHFIVMDVFKAELDGDPLDTDDDKNAEEEKSLVMEGNFLEVDVNEIKAKPYDLNHDQVSNMCEENEDPLSFSVLKVEVKEESWNEDAVKAEILPEVKKEHDDWLGRPMQQHCEENLTCQEIVDSRENSVQLSGMIMHTQSHTDETHQGFGFGNNPSRQKDLSSDFSTKDVTASQVLMECEEKRLKCTVEVLDNMCQFTQAKRLSNAKFVIRVSDGVIIFEDMH